MKLLTTNSKLEKDTAHFLTLGLQLAPAFESGVFNTCSHSTSGCRGACIFTSGRGKQSNVVKARIARTLLFWHNRAECMAQLHREITNGERLAKRQGKRLAVRLNVFSDLLWELELLGGKNLMEHFPNSQFYDYTKIPDRMTRFLKGGMPDNYHLTFSRAETKQNQKFCESIYGKGNVAAVFADSLPAEYKGIPVIDGDKSDLRFKDPVGCIVGLAVKGDGKKDSTGFVISQ